MKAYEDDPVGGAKSEEFRGEIHKSPAVAGHRGGEGGRGGGGPDVHSNLGSFQMQLFVPISQSICYKQPCNSNVINVSRIAVQLQREA